MGDWMHSHQLHKTEQNRSIRPNSFENYFEDYKAKEVPLPDDSGTQTIFTYAGIYYSERGTSRLWILRKIITSSAALLGFIIFFAYSSIRFPANQSIYISWLSFFILLCYFYLFYALINYIPSHRKMTIGSYRVVHFSMRSAPALLTLFQFIMFIARVISLYHHFEHNIQERLICVLGSFLCFFCSLFIFILHCHIHFEQHTSL